MRRWLIRLLLLVLGLVAAELGMRALGWGSKLASGRDGAVDRSPEARALLCIGDSCVWGPNFNPQQSYPARLEALLAGASDARRVVLNQGSPGRPSWEVAELVPRLLDARRFDALLVTVGVNNLWRDAAAEGRAAWHDSLRLWKLVRLVAARLRGEAARDRVPEALEHGLLDESAIRAQLVRDLGAVRDAARARSVPIFVVSYATDLGNYGIANRCLRASAGELGLPLVDCAPLGAELARRTSLEQVYFIDLHPKPPGYELVARCVYEALRAAGIHRGPELPDALEQIAAGLSARPLAELERSAAGALELVFHEGPANAPCLALAWALEPARAGEPQLPQLAEIGAQIGAALRAGALPERALRFRFDARGEARVPVGELLGLAAGAGPPPSGFRFGTSYVPLRTVDGRELPIQNSLSVPVELRVP